MTWNISLNFNTQGFWKFTTYFTNKWAPKSQQFFYLGMTTQSQLAIMDFKKGRELEHATAKAGEKGYSDFQK